MSTECQRVCQGVLKIHIHAMSLYIIQIQFFVRMLKTYSLMYITIVHLKNTCNKFNCSGCSKQMSDHGFCGVYFDIICMITKGCFDGSCLK